jgi:hypothetical protein
METGVNNYAYFRLLTAIGIVSSFNDFTTIN